MISFFFARSLLVALLGAVQPTPTTTTTTPTADPSPKSVVVSRKKRPTTPTADRRPMASFVFPVVVGLLGLLLATTPPCAEGAASGPLFGGAYVPTTDVSHVVTLSQLIHAISIEDAANGTALYQRQSFDANGASFSLESIFSGSEGTGTYVKSSNNPLYGAYMHSLWRSSHGSGSPSDDPLELDDQYNFLESPVEVYGATIIENMLTKPSGYDPTLTAEAIKVIGVWMAFAQSLYDAVSLCAQDANPDGDLTVMDVNDPGYVSPVDLAAAFWYGAYRRTDPDQLPEDDGSLYAWAEVARENFSLTQFDANDAVTSGLNKLQPLLPECLGYRSSGNMAAEVEDIAKRMRILADDIVRYASVPMVQNLIHHSARISLGVSVRRSSGRDLQDGTTDDAGGVGAGDDAAADLQQATTTAAPMVGMTTAIAGGDDAGSTPEQNDAVDWIILYGLSTIPPIRICDENAFNDLYGKLVSDAKSEVTVLDDGSGTGAYIESLDQDVLYDALNTLQSRLTCLGLTCEHIGTSNLLASSVEFAGPICSDPSDDYDVEYWYDDADSFLQHLKIDMDVRLIGALVEMDANVAAYDVYRWGRYMRRVGVDLETGRDVNDVDGVVIVDNNVALRDLAREPFHEQNYAGAAYASYLEQNVGMFTPQLTAFVSLMDAHVHEVTMELGRFGGGQATPSQRRSIVESALVAIATMHALNRMYEAVDACRNGNATGTTWDQAFAALSGWAEEDFYAKGFLIFDLACTGCEANGSCLCDSDTNDSMIKGMLVNELVGGKDFLTGVEDTAEDVCGDLGGVIDPIQELILTALVDAVAYYANQLSDDATRGDYLAKGYGTAIVLVPLIHALSPEEAEVIERNIGGFGTEAQPLVDGVGAVFEALAKFVVVSGINCELLTMKVLCGMSQSPNVAGGITTSPNVAGGLDMPSPTPPDGTFNPTMIVGGIDVPPVSCGSAWDGGLPGKTLMDDPPPALFGGLYQPNSDVDHIVKMTETLELIANLTDLSDGLSAYTDVGYDGVSLKCLSVGAQKDYILRTNPLFVIYMYGLWRSELGSSDPDGYSNKLFDFNDIFHYGDTIVIDEINKASGFDATFTAETIQVTNMWMAMITEMYRAAQLCRGGLGKSITDELDMDFNPVDIAAALWFGSAQDADTPEGGGLYAWAKRAGMKFVEQKISVNDEVNSRLTQLQTSFSDCKAFDSEEDYTMKGIEMMHVVDDITRFLMVPLVQHFINHLAIESGMTNEEATTDMRNHMALYALSVLPFISICDKFTSDELFSDLISGTANTVALNYDTFSNHFGKLQDKYKCLGITCDMVGLHVAIDSLWPNCTIPSPENTAFAGYVPTSDVALEMVNIDLDISTILALIVMEADSAALDVFHNGRNAIATINDGSKYLSLDSITTPIDADVNTIYQSFSSGLDGRNYMEVTFHAIEGMGAFQSASVLQKSAGASLAIATIDLQMAILLHTTEAVRLCLDSSAMGVLGGSTVYWDIAVAAFVGSNEGKDYSGSDVGGHLLFQLAQELCKQYDSCEDDGEPIINKNIMEQFNAGQIALSSGNCQGASDAQSNIESLLQAIIIDLVAYHAKLSDPTEESHCLMARIAAFALVPMMRRNSDNSDILAAANTIEGNTAPENAICGEVVDVEAVYQSLNTYVQFKSIDCAWLGSSVCTGTSTTPDYLGNENNDGYTPSPGNHTLFNGEYVPTVDVTGLQALSSVVSAICSADSTDVAKNSYINDATAGLTIESMSLDAKYVMSDELQFHQYIYALQDGLDATDGSILFDGKLATEYANTITSDALETNIVLGCQSIKVLNIWMWIVHKLNSMVDECRNGNMSSGLVDEAAALWEGGQLYALAEELGPKFSHDNDGGVTYLNRKIVGRFTKARDITSNNEISCGNENVHDLRIIVKEIVSYMTAVLIQSLIDSMLAEFNDNKNKVVELMAFATLPHIKTCGHEVTFDDLHNTLIKGFGENVISATIETYQSYYNCLGLSCDDVGSYDRALDAWDSVAADIMLPECLDITMIAGYLPENATKTNMVARLDLDAVAIHQLMSMEKFDLAKRIYIEGHNYYDYDNTEVYNFVSLYNLTQSHTIDYSDFPIYNLYNDYYGPDFSHQLLTQIFDKTAPFENATPSQRSLAVKVAISSFVSYMAALEALYSAVSNCEFEKTSSIHAFDGAVALLIGSVEGQGSGGSLNDEGQMLYSISKRNCNHFHDCLGSDSEVNEALFSTLTIGQEAIRQSLCEDATIAVDTINSLLKVPLTQSLLYFSDPVNKRSDYDAAGYVAMQAVIPSIENIDSDMAEAIKSAMSFDEFLESDVASPSLEEDDVRPFLRIVLTNPNSDIDCDLVSNGLCDVDGDAATDTPVDGGSDTPVDGGSDTPDDIIQAPPDVINPDDPTPIPFVTSNYVGDRSAIALDVAQIQSAMSVDDFQEATRIYNDGRNSKIYNENGITTGELRSIARFSKESGSTMNADSTYNLFIYGLSDDNQEFMGRPTTVYADTLISNLLYLKAPEAQTAMVAITIWMQVAHSLHSAYGACRSSISTEGRSGISGRNLQISDNDPSLFIDEAAAYWMGDNQDTGSSSQGHLLYALTEFIADEFETPSDAESTINLKVIDLFNQAKNHIAISRGCSTSEKSHLKLKGIIDELIPLMAVPLLRCLLYHLSKNELTMVKVYATAVLPLFSACASSTYRELKSLLIDDIPTDPSSVDIKKDYVVSRIQSMYSCLGLTCDLVGSMQNNDPATSPLCDGSSDTKSLAGYKYIAEQEIMNQASLIDVDIRKIDIFLENGMLHFPDSQEVSFGAAFDLYKDSLRNIARSTNRDAVPVFAAFPRYFDDDDYYADTMITSACQKQGAFLMATTDQRKRFITFALRYMVTFMAILEKIYTALKSCSNEEARGEGAMDLDIAIAYYMGSLEGINDGGSYDGSLIHMLANRMCVHFGTCSDEDDAVINERIISLVYTAQGELESGACVAMERTVKEIENALIVPLIQGVLFSARENELHYKKKNYAEDYSKAKESWMQEFYPEGYALAQSILPIIADVDRSAATNIKNVMVVSFPNGADDAQSNDSAKVHRAIKSAVSKMKGMDCSQIGSLGGVGFCADDDEDSYDALNSASCSPNSFAALLIAGVLVYI